MVLFIWCIQHPLRFCNIALCYTCKDCMYTVVTKFLAFCNQSSEFSAGNSSEIQHMRIHAGQDTMKWGDHMQPTRGLRTLVMFYTVHSVQVMH